MFDIELGAGRWRLLADHAMFELQQRLLVVADVHLGKAAAYRARGVPLSLSVQQGSTETNLARLSALIDALAPRQLAFLGDLVHARESLHPATMERVGQWRDKHAGLDMLLVEGNHDAAAGGLPPALGLRVVEEPWPVAGVWLAHHPQWRDGGHVLAGHLHPVLRVSGRGDDSARLPCFWTRRRSAMVAQLTVLPAFGEFTGGAPVQREAGDRVIAIAADRLFEIPAAPIAA